VRGHRGGTKTLKGLGNREAAARDAGAGLPAAFIAIYAFAYASLWLALLTPATITLALRVRQIVPGDAAHPISQVLFAGALVALVSNPVFGALSDRTHSRFGRRKPYLVIGAIGGFAALALIGVAGSVRTVMLGWCLAQLAYNAVLSALVAIVADRIPAARRGTVVGILGMCMPVGQITGTFLVQLFAPDLYLALLVPGGIGLFGVLALALSLASRAPAAVAAPEAAASKPAEAPMSASSAGTEAPVMSAHATPAGTSPQPQGHRDFAWAWSSRMHFVVGSVFLQAYQPLLLLDMLRLDAADVPRLIFRSTLVQAAMSVLWSVVAGRLSDRLGRRKPVAMVGSTLQGVGLWLIGMAPSYTMLLFGAAVAGIGHGIYEGVDLALVTEVLPDRGRHAAKDLGLLNIANTLPQVVAPLAAPVILDASHGNYTLLFLIAGALPLVGAVLLVPLKRAR
jgi:MFS family permease